MPAMSFIVAASTVLAPSAAWSQEVVLEPSSQWHLDYGEDKCRLARTFGEGERKTIFFLEQFSPGSGFSWVVAGPPVEAMRRNRDVDVQFGPGFASFPVEQDDGLTLDGFGEAIGGRGHKPPEGERVTAGPRMGAATGHVGDSGEDSGPTGLDPAEGRKIAYLALSQGEDKRSLLRLGDMEPAFKAVNACIDDLVESWGLDPAVLRTQVTGPAWTNADRLVSKIQDNYPSEALRGGNQANFGLRVMVGADGEVVGCHFTEMTSAENFSDRVCPIIMREAEFAPARDADGTAIPSYYTSRVLYRINP